jgi:hypothetical protein
VQAKDVKGKDGRPDPGRIKERLFTVGEFCARVTEVGEGGKSLKVVVPLRLARPNPAAVERLAELQGEAVAALRIEDPAQRLQEIQRVQIEVVKARADLVTFEDHEINVDLPLADETVVRTLVLPAAYDDKGLPRRYTAAELKELKGPARLPGYKAEREDLKANQVVRVTIKVKRGSPPWVALIVILGEVPEP